MPEPTSPRRPESPAELPPLPGLTQRQSFLVEQLNSLEASVREHRQRFHLADPSEHNHLALESLRLQWRERELTDELLSTAEHRS